MCGFSLTSAFPSGVLFADSDGPERIKHKYLGLSQDFIKHTSTFWQLKIHIYSSEVSGEQCNKSICNHTHFLGPAVLGTYCNSKDFYFYFSPAKSGAAG